MATGQILLSILVVAALLYGVSVVFHSIRDSFVAAGDLLRSLDEKLERVEKDLKRVKEVVEDLELPEDSRKQRTKTRAFEAARELPLPFLRNLPAGTILRLISRSRDDPPESAAIDEIEYRHERVEEGESSKIGRRIHGFSRRAVSDPWSPHTFFASDAQASSSSGSDHLRRRLK